MLGKGYTSEQIINKLREAEVLIAQGSRIHRKLSLLLDEIMRIGSLPYGDTNIYRISDTQIEDRVRDI